MQSFGVTMQPERLRQRVWCVVGDGNRFVRPNRNMGLVHVERVFVMHMPAMKEETIIDALKPTLSDSHSLPISLHCAASHGQENSHQAIYFTLTYNFCPQNGVNKPGYPSLVTPLSCLGSQFWAAHAASVSSEQIPCIQELFGGGRLTFPRQQPLSTSSRRPISHRPTLAI
ncbi:hypothetical protein LYNGBM3L_75460 [Moorena producens 3L]|uniref:Uncharacterized protein n=1 Tax=Moorena producens 3L TaxID=489825 RepID=F4XRD6_9CYAN|nr:hypothetical protein LYNGBM3L_75460 [Moorena producens 3L]